MLNWTLIRGLSEDEAKRLVLLEEQITIADSTGNLIPDDVRNEHVLLQCRALAEILVQTVGKPASQDASSGEQ